MSTDQHHEDLRFQGVKKARTYYDQEMDNSSDQKILTNDRGSLVIKGRDPPTIYSNQSLMVISVQVDAHQR